MRSRDQRRGLAREFELACEFVPRLTETWYGMLMKNCILVPMAIKGRFGSNNTGVQDLMTGRVVTVSFDDTLETNVELVEQAGFTTFFFSKTGRCKVP